MSGTRSHGGLTPLKKFLKLASGRLLHCCQLPQIRFPGTVDFISELVASTDDEDFAVLLADVECLPDEVLETLAAVLQSCAGRGGSPRR